MARFYFPVFEVVLPLQGCFGAIWVYRFRFVATVLAKPLHLRPRRFHFFTATCNVAVRKNNADGIVKSSLPLAVGRKNFYVGTALTWSE